MLIRTWTDSSCKGQYFIPDSEPFSFRTYVDNFPDCIETFNGINCAKLFGMPKVQGHTLATMINNNGCIGESIVWDVSRCSIYSLKIAWVDCDADGF